MKKVWTCSAVFSVVFLLVSSSFAQPPRFKDRRDLSVRPPLTRVAAVLESRQKELGISETQIEEIKDIFFSFRKKMIQLRKEKATERLELMKLLRERDQRDYEKIREDLSGVSDIREEIVVERLKMREEMKNVLSEEQRVKLRNMIKQRVRRRALFKRWDRLHDRRVLRRR